MMLNKILAIIRKDIVLRFQSRGEWIFFLILPLIFTLIVGGGFPGLDGDSRASLPIVDEDGGARAAAFLQAMRTSQTVRVEPMTRAAAEERLNEGDAGAILIIPAGFSEGLSADGLLGDAAAEVVLLNAPNSNVGLLAEQEVTRAAAEVARPLLVARNSTLMVESARPFPGDAERVAFFNEVASAAEAAPKITRVEQAAVENAATYDQRAQASAGQVVTWVFVPLLGASELFAMERVLGTLRRVLVTPTRKSTYLLGAISGQYLAALAQMALLVLFGIYVMKVPWGREPLALVVVLAAFALAGVALGTMLGTFVKTESQASNLSIMLGMSMALLGGAWFPMELFPTGLQQVVKVLPTTWAMSAMTDLTMRGLGLPDILPETAVLLGFAAVFFAIGVWRFRYE